MTFSFLLLVFVPFFLCFRFTVFLSFSEAVSLSLSLGAPSLSGTGAVFGSLSFHLSFVFLLPISFRFQSNGYRFYPGLGYLKNVAKIEISVFLA